ncbi:MAG: phage shock envelope stress response protein PspM [Sciscionella sp.]
MVSRGLISLARVVGSGARHPVVADLRDKVATWRDPRARLLRRRRRSARVTTIWGGLTAVVGAVAGGEFATAVGPGVGAYTAAGLGVLTAAVAVNSGVQTYRLYKEPLPESSVVPRALPRVGSAARAPIARLQAAETSLRTQLSQLAALGTALPVDVVSSTRSAAAGAAGRLRALAEQLQAVESARSASPAGEGAELNEAIPVLAAQLHAGVDDYGRLVAAAGRAVAASAVPGSRTEVIDATEALQGLALALRELPPQPQA